MKSLVNTNERSTWSRMFFVLLAYFFVPLNYDVHVLSSREGIGAVNSVNRHLRPWHYVIENLYFSLLSTRTVTEFFFLFPRFHSRLTLIFTCMCSHSQSFFQQRNVYDCYREQQKREKEKHKKHSNNRGTRKYSRQICKVSSGC